MPTSLALHDMGLSTFISYSNVDANGIAISSDQISKVQRMRRWNKISSNNRSYERNLKNAFAILNSLKDKLSLNDSLLEKSAYNYRKGSNEFTLVDLWDKGVDHETENLEVVSPVRVGSAKMAEF